MTKRSADQGWARLSDRPISPNPVPVPPHPEHGDLPPCESGIKGGAPCPRPATTHYGYGYYCDEHMDWIYAGEAHDEASWAMYHAKRLLWKAQVEGIERLEYHIGVAVAEIAQDIREADARIRETAKKAGMGDE